MDSLDLIKTFREVAAHGSFSRAATRLSMSRANVSKYVAMLETRFGVRLLNRSTRSVSLTDAGALLLERSTPVLELIELTQADLTQHASQPRGRLVVSATHGMARGRLSRVLAEFMGHYPEVTLSLHLNNRVVDLAEEGVDVALRIGPVADDNLIVRRLLCLPMMVCAAPRYWQRRGRPQHPRELAAHDGLTHTNLGLHPHWRFEVDGQALDVSVNRRMDANDIGPLIEAAVQGLGIVYSSSLPLQTHVDQGTLEPVLQPYVRTDMWISAAYLQRRHNSAALRTFLDFLETRFKRGDRLQAGAPAVDEAPPARVARPHISRRSTA